MPRPAGFPSDTVTPAVLRRTRTLFTLLSVLAAFLLFGLLDSVHSAFDAASHNVAGVDRLVTVSKVSFTLSLPKSLYERIRAVPAAGTEVPLWILGSSNFGAMLAAELGLPYAFASHFAPELLIPALQIYRSRFKPSEQLDRPYAMVGVNIIAADSDNEARRLATTQQMSFTNIFRGARGLSQPPIDDIESYWSPAEKAQAMSMLARSIVGSPDTVRSGIDALVAEVNGEGVIRQCISGEPEKACELGRRLAERLIAAGADRFLDGFEREEGV